jgi:hypothetical protein
MVKTRTERCSFPMAARWHSLKVSMPNATLEQRSWREHPDMSLTTFSYAPPLPTPLLVQPPVVTPSPSLIPLPVD